MAVTLRRSCGGAGRVRPGGCAPSAPLQSPCTLQGPGDMRRRLCVDMARMSNKQADHHQKETEPNYVSYFSSARALRAGLTERIPKTSSVSFSLKLSQSSYTCQQHIDDGGITSENKRLTKDKSCTNSCVKSPCYSNDNKVIRLKFTHSET